MQVTDSTSSNMENVIRLQICHERNITFKQAFSNRRMVDDRVQLKNLTAKEEFSALVNWILQEMPRYERMTLRADMEGITYETIVYKDQYKIRMSKIKKCGPGIIRYDWREGLLYCSLDLREINEGIQRANMINETGMARQQIQQEQVMDISQPELVNGDAEIWAITSNIPRIRMRETDTNFWEVVLNEEERQLIDEFLQT